MEYTSSQLFDEVIQLATPDCIKRRDMTVIRKIKDLQNYTQRLEQIAEDAIAALKDKEA
jgi:phage host-nuclease inhibitor protein Gam